MKEKQVSVHLKNLSLEELESFVGSLGEKPFRFEQLARWLYQNGARSFAEMTDLAKSFRKKLEESSDISFLSPTEIKSSPDGTQKYLFLLSDGEKIESVLLKEKGHFTLCLSTQVGCSLGCKFCFTGKLGFIRNLGSAEIIDQIIGVRSTLPPEVKITNLVFMGMGEPLNNFDNLIQALNVIRSPKGLQFSHRRVTLSTAGLIPGIQALFSRWHFIKLAISLNASTQEQRSKLMPISRKYPLADLLEACRKIPLDNRERITFEYVLLKGVNDTEEDAHRLASLLRGIQAKINLIPFNEHPEIPFQRPSSESIQRFQEILMTKRFTTIVRHSKGRDVLAACGQLGGRNRGRKIS
jgi:23S rRNA (adenine2503-C2)-methyltransferase